VLWDNLEGWGGERDGRGVREGGDTCIPLAEKAAESSTLTSHPVLPSLTPKL